VTSKNPAHLLPAVRKLGVPSSLFVLALLTTRLAVAQTVMGKWEFSNKTDLDGNTTPQAIASGHTHDGQQDGQLSVTATCRTGSGNNTTYRQGRQVQVPFDFRSVNFLIIFISDEKPGVGFLHSGPRVHMRVKIDDDKSTPVFSVERFYNYADVVFQTMRGGTNGDGTVRGDGPDEIGKLIHAHRVLVELTTENNAQHILEIRPQDPLFQQFMSQCGYDRPAPPLQLPEGTQTKAPAPPIGATRMAFNRAFLGPPEKIGERTYTGTLDGFVAALPGYIQKAAAGIGAPPRSYDYEVRYIGEAARLCAGITADEAAGVTVRNFIDVSRLGPDYRPCAALYGVPVPRQVGPPDPSHPAELLVMIRPHKSWGDGSGISVVVAFTERGFPGTRSGARQSCAMGWDCGVVTGVIQASGR
jgi:hypothetical protein